MRSIRYLKPGLSLMDVPEPNIVNDDDVKIKISYCAICGTDAHFYAGHLDEVVTADRLPLKLGHEATGIVTALGKKTGKKGLNTGDRVTYYFKSYCGTCYYCRNGQEQHCQHAQSNMSAMSDYIVVSEQQVYKLPDAIDMKIGCLSEPVSVCLHGTDLANIRPGKKVAVSGGGGVGLLCMQLAKLSGACEVTLIEPVKEKRDLALKMGAKHVIDPLSHDVQKSAEEITHGLGFDSVIETSGSKHACQPAYDILAKGGTLVYFALYGTEYAYPVNMWSAFNREATIRFVYQSPYVWPRCIGLLEELCELESMVNTVFKPEDYIKGFDEQLTGKPPKVLFCFD
jgi:(R,R)-butanediol dehydrogenase/meso-butanediol dehydrogenase/diacetyl reductase/L-iditol 2-dehydrogenase